jgi:glycosyltransferase involved in cell wall biosynthesis
MKIPSVSVIVPAYNAARYIGDALESLLSQTRVPDEIIIVNDGSTDETRQVVTKYKDSRIEYVEQQNGGISSARNRGMQRASGDYIAFLDADDRWRKTMLEKQLAVLEHDPTLVCSFTNFVRFEDSTGATLGDQFRYYHGLASLPCRRGPVAGSYVLTVDPFIALISFGEIPCFMQTTLYRANAIAGMTFNTDLYLGEDYEFALRSYLKGNVAYISETLADVRRHESNTTKDYRWFPVYKLQAFKCLERYVISPERVTAYRDRLIKGHIEAACVHCIRGELKSGLRVFIDGLSVPGSRKRKLKGAARLTLTIAQRAINRQ